MNDKTNKTNKTTATEPDDTEGNGFKIGGGISPEGETDDTEGHGMKFPEPAAVEPDRDTGGNA
jgi:hypothetical protein